MLAHSKRPPLRVTSTISQPSALTMQPSGSAWRRRRPPRPPRWPADARAGSCSGERPLRRRRARTRLPTRLRLRWLRGEQKKRGQMPNASAYLKWPRSTPRPIAYCKPRRQERNCGAGQRWGTGHRRRRGQPRLGGQRVQQPVRRCRARRLTRRRGASRPSVQLPPRARPLMLSVRGAPSRQRTPQRHSALRKRPCSAVLSASGSYRQSKPWPGLQRHAKSALPPNAWQMPRERKPRMIAAQRPRRHERVRMLLARARTSHVAARRLRPLMPRKRAARPRAWSGGGLMPSGRRRRKKRRRVGSRRRRHGEHCRMERHLHWFCSSAEAPDRAPLWDGRSFSPVSHLLIPICLPWRWAGEGGINVHGALLSGLAARARRGRCARRPRQRRLSARAMPLRAARSP